ncbi:MAG TPA: potassium-transporting ATPase subunit KdpC [Candidatus Saccharimonadales bacterium]|jgi:K+-transporting ATPase ATPase C chain|nr:potassium-transporting ATPase subunit KdpC [Candidatus Saccharimonadales bacterium]
MKLLIQSILLTIIFTVLTGIIYPLAITGISQVAFHDQANGSLLVRDGKVVGSELLAQQFTGDKYFWPRPSAGSYATVPSGASNLGPTSQALQSNVTANAMAFRTGNKLAADAPVPADMVFTSGSGLDPHISPEAARLQVARVAAARSMGADQVKALVEKFVESPQWGIFGEARVNVLRLNLALDEMDTKKAEGTGAVKG